MTGRRIEDGTGFLGRVALDQTVRRSVASLPDVRLVSDRETSELTPAPADHYFDDFRVTSDDGTVASIDIHHIGSTGIKELIPTVVRIIETSGEEKQVDIFSIDDHGNVIAHTNIRGETRTKDTSRERLLRYGVEISQRAERFPINPRLRLQDAVYQPPQK